VDLSDASVGQLMLPVADVERAVTYYRDVLGLPFLFAAPPQMAFFQCGGVRLLVGVPESAEHRRRGGTVYFRVGDIQAVHATLAARGVTFQAAPHVVHRTPTSDLWLAEFQDPDGNHLALMADVPATPAPERTG
jgi:methylmalonyl-CoA/ethylmalonyl-CoA epimerase